VEQLRTTADESTTCQNKCFSDNNWIELIKNNPTLSSQVLNAALSRYPSTKNVVDLTKDGTSNETGLYRNNKKEKKRQVYYYDLTVPGSSVDELLWRNGPFYCHQEREREYSRRQGSI
jgi:hypothetical protein